MRLAVTHKTCYEYAQPQFRLALRLKLFPASFDAQSVVEWSVTVNGTAVERLVVDGCGDGLALWTARDPVDAVEIVASGLVVTTDRAGVVAGLRRRPPPAVFLRQTKLTRPDAELLALGEEARSASSGDALSSLHALMRIVNARVPYRPRSTHMGTTAAEALASGAGVCQDQTHVFVAAARTLLIPARYIVGYVLPDEAEDESRRDDQDVERTHAWAEAFVEGIGWVGFDPTHDVCPTDRYIRLVSGHDAAHAAPIRASGAPACDSRMVVSVEVRAVDGRPSGDGQSQSQSGSGQSQSQSQTASR